MKKLCWVFGLLCCFSGWAQTGYNLEGTFGKSAVYLQFTDDPSDPKYRIGDARYFYKNTLQDIELEGKFEKQHYIFSFAENESFSLTKNKDGTFSGNWSNAKGKSLPVLLRPIAGKIGTEPNPLDSIKKKLIGFRKDSTSVFHGKKIDWYCETHSATTLFRLAGGYPKHTLDRINAVLENMHCGLALEQLGCTNPYAYSNGKNIEFDIRLGYLDENLLGFELFGYYDCGGAHPSSGTEGQLIDLHTVKKYDIDDVLAFDASVAHDDEQADNSDQFFAYREDFFAPKLYALLQRQFHFEKPENENEDECDYTDLELWTFASWNFTEKGIEFTPSFPHAMQPCVQSFLLPFDALRAYKNPVFPYRF